MIGLLTLRLLLRHVDKNKMQKFDYIIVGAGSAGCIVAARLSENPKHNVLLIEAGVKDNSPWIRIPAGYAKSYYNPKVNWMYWSEPEQALNGRRIYVPRGKVQGGSGSINAMVFVRGAPADFDDWAAKGNPGWGYEDILPFFRKMETYAGGETAYRGGSGPIHVTSMHDQVHSVTKTFLAACEGLRYRRNQDFNAADIEGIGVYDINTLNGVRSSSSLAYLHPALKRPNLNFMYQTQVRRIVLNEEGRAIGVEFDGPSGRTIYNARAEVILACGAIDTPKLLQLSGIGDGALLQNIGIPTFRHLPAVGKNLQDHLCASIYYRSKVPTLNDQLGSFTAQAWQALRYMLTRRGPLALSVNQAGGFLRGSPKEKRPNIQLYFNPLSYRIPSDPKAGLVLEPYSGFLLAFNSCRPTSRGSVSITSADPTQAAQIKPNYLSTERDEEEALQGARLARHIMNAPELREITENEMAPTDAAHSDAELMDYFRNNCGSIYHHCGTAAMGPDARTSVVDGTLKVHGVEGLRIVDASIFPNITSGNINAPTMMVAEKGATLIANSMR